MAPSHAAEFRSDSQETLVPSVAIRPDSTINNAALVGLLHSLGEALHDKVYPIDEEPRKSIVKCVEGHTPYSFIGDWAQIEPRVKEISHQWSKLGAELGIQPSKIRLSQDARDKAYVLHEHRSAIDSVIKVIQKGSRATMKEFDILLNSLAGTEDINHKIGIPHNVLSHRWSLNQSARSKASNFSKQTMEAYLEIYRQQQEFEKATGRDGTESYDDNPPTKASSSKV